MLHLHKIICCDPSSELPRRGSSDEGSQHMVSMRNKNIYPSIIIKYPLISSGGWSGGAMALGKLPASGHPTIWMIVGQRPVGLAVGVGGGCLDFLLSSVLSLLCFLWETA